MAGIERSGGLSSQLGAINIGPLRIIVIVLQLLTGCAFVITLAGLCERSVALLTPVMPWSFFP